MHIDIRIITLLSICNYHLCSKESYYNASVHIPQSIISHTKIIIYNFEVPPIIIIINTPTFIKHMHRVWRVLSITECCRFFATFWTFWNNLTSLQPCLPITAKHSIHPSVDSSTLPSASERSFSFILPNIPLESKSIHHIYINMLFQSPFAFFLLP